MKTKYLKIREDMQLGELVAIPYQDGYKVGVIDGLNHEFYSLKVIRKSTYFEDEDIQIVPNKEGGLMLGVPE